MTGIPYLDEAQLGPEMRKLTKLQRVFVHQLLMNGGNKAGAYVAAGYNPGSVQLAADGGHKLAFQQNIQKALVEYGKLYIGSKLGAWIKGIEEIADNPEASQETRFKAKKLLLEHAGLVVETQQKITVEHSARTREETLALENQLKRELGMVVDAEYEIVPEREAIAEVTGAEGIEDLL